MSQMTIKAIETELRVRILDQSMIDESMFSVYHAEIALALADQTEPYGELVLRGGGQHEIILSDDLLPLASGLSAAVAALRAGQEAQIISFGEPFDWTFKREGVRIITRAVQPGELFLPEPKAAESNKDNGEELLDAAAYKSQELSRDDDAASLIAALGNAAERLLALLEGGHLRAKNASFVLTHARSVLSGRTNLPDKSRPRRN